MPRLLGQPAKAEVAAIAIDFANAGHQVVQISLGLLVNRVVAGAVLATALLPALALMADLPGRNNMLPLDAGCAFGIFTWHITAGCKVHPVTGVLAATVKLGGLGRVEFPGDLFRFGKSARRVGLRPHDKKQKQQSKPANTHRLNLPSAQPRKSAHRHRRDRRG
ncbi:hypothetical protein D3C80_781530 [compost metagenome]